MRFLLFISLFLLCFGVASSQQKKPINSSKAKIAAKCQLTKAPILRGFSLGQSVSEIDRMIPGFEAAYELERNNENSSIIDTEYRGPWENRLNFRDVDGVYLSGYFDENSRLIIDDYSDRPKKPMLFSGDSDGLHKLVWWFFEDKLYGFSIYYSDYAPDSVLDFAKQLSEKTGLPKTGWVATDKADIGSNLVCNGFKVRVHTAYRDSAHITITDTITEAKVFAMEKAVKAQRKREELERIRKEKEKINTLKP